MAEKKRKKPNPYNHPIAQALIDIKQVLWDLEIYLTDINDIIEEINTNEDVRERALKLWLSHRFPEKSIRFIMTLIYDGCPERYELPIEEQAILGLMERIQNQTNGAVAVYKTVFAKVMHLNDRQRKNLQKSIDHLTETCFLTCIYRPPKGSKRPGIYIVNRAVSWIGTGTDNAKGLSIKRPGTYKQILETAILPDGTNVTCGTLGEIPKQEKEASADQDTDLINNTAELYNGSAPQNDSNRNNKKKQVSVANSNMPKNENILTPEENEMFSGTLKERGAEYEQHTNL